MDSFIWFLFPKEQNLLFKIVNDNKIETMLTPALEATNPATLYFKVPVYFIPHK